MDWKKRGFVEKKMDVLIKKGNERWWKIVLVDKEGKERKMVMREVEKFWGEEEVSEVMEF